MNKLNKVLVSIFTLVMISACNSGGGSGQGPASNANPSMTTTPDSSDKTNYVGIPKNFNGQYVGPTTWTTASGVKNKEIVLFVKQSETAIGNVTIFPSQGGGSLFDLGGSRIFVITYNQLFEKWSGQEPSQNAVGEIGDSGFYVNLKDFADLEIKKLDDKKIHLRLLAAQLSPTPGGRYVETLVEGDLTLE